MDSRKRSRTFGSRYDGSCESIRDGGGDARLCIAGGTVGADCVWVADDVDGLPDIASICIDSRGTMRLIKQ